MTHSIFDQLHELGERIASAPATLVFLDLDGTLTEFTDDPDDVRLSPSLRDILERLSAVETVVATIVSGRERSDLQARVGIPGLIYAGNHGLEISGPGVIFVEPSALTYREPLRELTTKLAERLQNVDGAFVEDKGLTASVHYRRVPESDHEEVRRIVHSSLENAQHPFVLNGGDKVYEIRPRVYWDKGSAVKWIIERFGKPDALVIYLGDDTTDEDAFAVLPEGITIKVGASTESAARYDVAGPQEVEEFLGWLEAQLKSDGRSQKSEVRGQKSAERVF